MVSMVIMVHNDFTIVRSFHDAWSRYLFTLAYNTSTKRKLESKITIGTTVTVKIACLGSWKNDWLLTELKSKTEHTQFSTVPCQEESNSAKLTLPPKTGGQTIDVLHYTAFVPDDWFTSCSWVKFDKTHGCRTLPFSRPQVGLPSVRISWDMSGL